jgi:hypothetical protein
MFRPSDIVIEAFVEHLGAAYGRLFDAGARGHREAIATVARAALSRIARSNAPYHDLDHTIRVTSVGQDILRGRMVRDGDVAAADWVHFVASLLCGAIGLVRGACPGDDGDGCVVDADGGRVALPRGASDGYLWPYVATRNEMFVRSYCRDHPVLDAERLAANVAYAGFPPRDHDRDTATYPGLLRAAQLIAIVADPDFELKIKRLVLELVESGLADRLEVATVEGFVAAYPRLFWTTLHPRLGDGLELLKQTGEGRLWLAHLHAHLLRGEPQGASD